MGSELQCLRPFHRQSSDALLDVFSTSRGIPSSSGRVAGAEVDGRSDAVIQRLEPTLFTAIGDMNLLLLQQALTKLVLPCGLVWLGIAILAVAAWRAKRRRLCGALLLLFAAYTVAGNSWVSTGVNYYLERDYRNLRLNNTTH